MGQTEIVNRRTLGGAVAAVLVVGSRGRSALREILLGSVAMAALHHSPRPVVVVPHRADEPWEDS